MMKLPVRMVPFEQLMLHLNQPQFPNVLGVRLHFRGSVDRARAEEAHRQATARHLFAQATIDAERARFVATEPPRRIVWLEAVHSWPALWRRIDAIQSHVVVESASDETRLSIVAPHALVDGLGGLQFACDWMSIYHNLLHPNQPVRLPRIDPQRLADRGKLHMLRWGFVRKLPFQAIAAFGAAKFIWRKPASMSAIREPIAATESPLGEAYPRILNLRIDPSGMRQLRSAARRLGVARQDLLLAGWFAAIADWREALGIQSERDWIRLLVPLTTRTREDRRLSACNRVSLVQVDRNPDQIRAREDLARGVARELQVIRRWELDRTMLLALNVAARVPGEIRRVAQKTKRRATSIATYLGRGLAKLSLPKTPEGYRVGDLELVDVEMLSPLLAGTPASLALIEFRDQLIATLHVDPRVIDAKGAERLLDVYREALQRLS